MESVIILSIREKQRELDSLQKRIHNNNQHEIIQFNEIESTIRKIAGEISKTLTIRIIKEEWDVMDWSPTFTDVNVYLDNTQIAWFGTYFSSCDGQSPNKLEITENEIRNKIIQWLKRFEQNIQKEIDTFEQKADNLI